MRQVPIMPESYKGEIKKGGGYTKNLPRQWTKQEIDWVKKMLDDGFTNKEIAQSIQRSEVSTSIKVKRLGKKSGNYNAGHIIEKNELNQKFLNYIKPKTVIDAYAGEKSFYADKGLSIIANDKNLACNTDYHLDAFKFLCGQYVMNEKADLIDLDPFGSAYDCFDLAIKMAKKGLVITFGELGHKRWRRLDYVRSHYGINSVEDFTLENLIEYVQEIGKRNKKELKVVYQKEWKNIGRVWFEIQPLKITEQWKGEIKCK